MYFLIPYRSTSLAVRVHYQYPGLWPERFGGGLRVFPELQLLRDGSLGD